MPKYSETHHLNIDDAGLASVHVALHLQGVDLPAARLFVLKVLDVAGKFARPLEVQAPPDGILVRQTSGPCVHFDPDGTFCPSGDGENGEHQDEAPLCAYPTENGVCPHLDNPDVLCPVKDACYAQVCSLCGYYDERSEHVDNIDPCTHPDACEGGCPYLDDDGIYCPQKEELAWALGDDIPKFVPLAQDPEGWGTDMVVEAPDTIPRSDYVPAPTPDFVGDTAPVTQCDEDPVFAVPRPTYRPGDRVRITHALHRGQTGKIERYFPATENYLVAIDGMPDRILLRGKDLEVGA